MKKISLALFVASLMALPSISMANDFSTVTRVQYVLDCMDSNPKMNVYEGSNKCSCVVDEIAKVFTQREYEDINTGYQMSNLPADRGGVFRDDDRVGTGIKSFKQVHAEAYESCRIRR